MANPDQETELSLWCSEQTDPDARSPKHRLTVPAADPIEWEEQPCPVRGCGGVIRRCSAPAIDLTKFPPMRQPRL